MTVAIVDHGLCNLDSIARALEHCGAQVSVTSDPADLERASHVVLPGVGAFGAAMDRLDASGLSGAIRKAAGHDRPVLGICLGMQLLLSTGTEGGDRDGLGLIDGAVRRLDPVGDERVPHMGWNEVVPEGAALFEGIEPGTDFYFVHSYHVVPEAEAEVAARTPYAGGFVSAVNRGRVYGVQFHPEKSQTAGFAVIRNFLEQC